MRLEHTVQLAITVHNVHNDLPKILFAYLFTNGGNQGGCRVGSGFLGLEPRLTFTILTFYTALHKAFGENAEKCCVETPGTQHQES